jgi:hypothetical protein
LSKRHGFNFSGFFLLFFAFLAELKMKGTFRPLKMNFTQKIVAEKIIYEQNTPRLPYFTGKM